MEYAEIPGNSRREFYDGKFPGIPGGLDHKGADLSHRPQIVWDLYLR